MCIFLKTFPSHVSSERNFGAQEFANRAGPEDPFNPAPSFSRRQSHVHPPTAPWGLHHAQWALPPSQTLHFPSPGVASGKLSGWPSGVLFLVEADHLQVAFHQVPPSHASAVTLEQGKGLS